MNNLRYERLRRGLTQTEVSEMMGVPQSTLSLLENKKIWNGSLTKKTIRRIERFFSAPIQSLLSNAPCEDINEDDEAKWELRRREELCRKSKNMTKSQVVTWLLNLVIKGERTVREMKQEKEVSISRGVKSLAEIEREVVAEICKPEAEMRKAPGDKRNMGDNVSAFGRMMGLGGSE